MDESRPRCGHRRWSRSNGAACTKNWSALAATFSSFRREPKLPDMVFTANAGLAVGKKFIPSNFRHQERAGEAPFFADWMKEHGYEVIWLPKDQYFEGEGDALFAGEALFCGYKFRTDVTRA